MSVRKSHPRTREVGARLLRQERMGASVSQQKLAQMLNVSQPLVSSWEAGRITMSIEDIVAVEKALGSEPASLLYRIAYPDENPNIEQ